MFYEVLWGLVSSQKTMSAILIFGLQSESNLQHFPKWWLSLSVSVRKDLGQIVKKYRIRSIVGFSVIILLGRGLLPYVLILGRFVFMLAMNPEAFVGELESLKTGWIFRFTNLNLNIHCNLTCITLKIFVNKNSKWRQRHRRALSTSIDLIRSITGKCRR